MVNSAETKRIPQWRLNLVEGPTVLNAEAIERAAEAIASGRPIVLNIEANHFATSQPKIFPGYKDARYLTFTGELLISRSAPISKKFAKQLGIESKKPISQVVWDTPETIEHGIGNSVHALENYFETGRNFDTIPIIQGLEDVYAYSQNLIRRIEAGELTVENLREEYEAIYRLFEQRGLLKSRTSNIQLAVEQGLAAVELDSTNRINPTISRMRLASASIKWMAQLFISDQAIDKRFRLLLGLLQERSMERFNIEQVFEKVQGFLGLDLGSPLAQEEKEQLYETILELFRHDTIKAAPYRIPAFRFLFSCFGVPNVRTSGLRSLFTHMFGPDSENPIPNTRDIEQDFLSDDPEAQLRFRARLKDGSDLMQDALKQGSEKFHDYEETIPKLLVSVKQSQENS